MSVRAARPAERPSGWRERDKTMATKTSRESPGNVSHTSTDRHTLLIIFNVFVCREFSVFCCFLCSGPDFKRKPCFSTDRRREGTTRTRVRDKTWTPLDGTVITSELYIKAQNTN